MYEKNCCHCFKTTSFLKCFHVEKITIYIDLNTILHLPSNYCASCIHFSDTFMASYHVDVICTT